MFSLTNSTNQRALISSQDYTEKTPAPITSILRKRTPPNSTNELISFNQASPKKTVSFEGAENLKKNLEQKYENIHKKITNVTENLYSTTENYNNMATHLSIYIQNINFLNSTSTENLIDFEKCNEAYKGSQKPTLKKLTDDLCQLRLNLYQLHFSGDDRSTTHLMLGFKSPSKPSKEVYERFLEELVSTYNFLMLEMNMANKKNLAIESYTYHTKNIDLIEKYIVNLKNSFYDEYGQKPIEAQDKENFINTLDLDKYPGNLETIQKATKNLLGLSEKGIEPASMRAADLLEELEGKALNDSDKNILKKIKTHFPFLLKYFDAEDQKKEVLNFVSAIFTQH